jgi:lysine 6-dehydrogenase
MRMLVLGAGLQGSACAYDLLQNPEVEHVILADLHIEGLAPYLQEYRDDARLQLVRIDARNQAEVLQLMTGVNACMNALPYFLNFEMARIAVQAGTHYCDLGGNTELVFKQLELDGEAGTREVSVIADCGLAPGMVNILGAEGIRQMDRTDRVRLMVGGLPQEPEPPLNYKIVYSLQGVLDYYTTPSTVLTDGKPREVKALSEVELIEFPEPVGRLEAFHTAGGLSTMPWTYQDQIRLMEYKTLRYPGHAFIMEAIRDLGLLDREAISVGDVAIAPRDVFIARVEPLLKQTGGKDLVALRVDVEGERQSAPHWVRYDLLDFFDEATGISAMERTTGFSLSITGQLQVQGHVDGPGVRTPDQAIPALLYIDELDRRGIHIQRSEKPEHRRAAGDFQP